MWGHIILFLLADGICICVYVADVFLVRCWSVVAFVFAADLFSLRKDSFTACFRVPFPVWRGTISTTCVYLVYKTDISAFT
jgi:hypothetical protein